MKSPSLNPKPTYKLNDFIQVSLHQHIPLHIKKPHLTFHQHSRLQTDITDKPIQRQPCTTSFYDSFQFVDHLTNNKMVYRDVRRGSSSLMQLRKLPSTKIEERPHLNSLLQIYKKTKNFQMKSLKQKIFKKIESVNDLPQKTTRNSADFKPHKRKCQNSVSLIHPKPATAENFIERSRKKNKMKSFLDRTIMNMNRAELQRIVSDKSPARQEVMQLNENLLDMKCTMDKEKIEELLYLREKQNWEMGKPNKLVEREQPIVFREVTNVSTGGNEKREQTDTKLLNQQQNSKTVGRNKRKKASLADQKDNFLERMLVHAQNQLKKEAEYLIQPNKQNLSRNMLIKRCGKRFVQTFNGDADNDLVSFCFEKKEQSALVSEVKFLVAKKAQNNDSSQALSSLRASEDEKSVIYLLKHNYVTNLGMELSTNPDLCYTKDEKGNNLLHMAVRYERPEMIEMIFKKVPYRVCRSLLSGQNNHKRTPLQMAKLVVDVGAVHAIEQFILKNRQRDIVEEWISAPGCG